MRDKRSKATVTVRGVVRWSVKVLVMGAIFGVAMFLAAGRLDWAAAWAYLIVYVVNQIVMIVALPSELLVERSKMQEGTKQWDTLLSVLSALAAPLAIYVVSGLDVRHGWSNPALLIQGMAWGVMVFGIIFTDWAMKANAFFSGTVRIQEDRGHAVAAGGPYRFVRHPGYVGAVLHHAAVPLALGSVWGLVPGLLGVAAVAVRTALEDRTLREELEGYTAYAEKTRYRLIPGIW
ncbi:MAG: isoprenylcysteine carboxylmethyltransferase family protein [Anaerolineae bacterium]|nr:isoprenylcysteine carboxylmethyltransferase family protein [Anaerolineae bacterium]